MPSGHVFGIDKDGKAPPIEHHALTFQPTSHQQTNDASNTTIMKSSMQTIPTLKPHHFEGLQTRMVNGGLNFAVSLTPEDWNDEYQYPHTETCEAVDDRLKRLAAARSPGRVVLNPRTFSISAIRQLCWDIQPNRSKTQPINVEYGLPQRFDRRWKTELVPGNGKSESQHLVLVAFDEHSRFAGYCGLTASLRTPLDGSRAYLLLFSIDLVYVLPERRGLGFGLDLSIATGMLCQDLLRASYRGVPTRSSILPYVSADYESEGGESFTLHVTGALNSAVDSLSEELKRPSVLLDHTELDAGY